MQKIREGWRQYVVRRSALKACKIPEEEEENGVSQPVPDKWYSVVTGTQRFREPAPRVPRGIRKK